jgi:hypothetical protein
VWSLKKLEVLDSIVRLASVHVMDVLMPVERPTDGMGHHEAVLGDISVNTLHCVADLIVTGWHDVHVTFARDPPALPKRMPLPAVGAAL